MEDDPSTEWKLRAAAIPIAFVLALAFHAWPTGHFLQRTFLSMPLHELGHAMTGWWCGFATVPTVWKTLIPETRSVLVTVIVVAVLGFAAYRAWATHRMLLFATAAIGLVLVFVGTTADVDDAQAAITFGGDAGAIVIGSALILTMFAPPDSRLRTNQLRWGFLAIGAAGFVDTFATWWTARGDVDVIPFGEIEGVGLSDPSKLVEVYGWTTQRMIDRYVLVGGVCATIVIATWIWQTWRTRVGTPDRA